MIVNVKSQKPLGGKAYGHIPHLPGSRMGPGDHHCHDGQARIATEKTRDKNDVVIVTEKLDGSCCAVARIDGKLVPLTRAGWPALTSPYRQHHLFHDWVLGNRPLFDCIDEGERIIGEWLAQAHGTQYHLRGLPFVAFDIMRGTERLPYKEFLQKLRWHLFVLPVPAVLCEWPCSVDEALARLGTHGHYGALDPVEGAVWRVERNGKFDFLCKFVRPDKVDGAYLPEVSGKEPVWNWLPGGINN